MTTVVHLYISKIPASESYPFEISLETANGQRVDDEQSRLVYRTTETHEETLQIDFNVPDPKIARTTVCEIRFSAPKIQINAVQRFNLTDDGAFILFARVEGRGIELKQRHDDRFGVVEVVTERIERVQGPRRGFIVDHRSGRVIMAGESTPWTRPDAVVKQTGTTITRETVTTNTKDNTVSRKVTTENVPTESPAQTSSDGGGNEDDWAAQLEKLADLKAKGILTEDEFQQAKKRLLGL